MYVRTYVCMSVGSLYGRTNIHTFTTTTCGCYFSFLRFTRTYIHKRVLLVWIHTLKSGDFFRSCCWLWLCRFYFTTSSWDRMSEYQIVCVCMSLVLSLWCGGVGYFRLWLCRRYQDLCCNWRINFCLVLYRRSSKVKLKLWVNSCCRNKKPCIIFVFSFFFKLKTALFNIFFFFCQKENETKRDWIVFRFFFYQSLFVIFSRSNSLFLFFL